MSLDKLDQIVELCNDLSTEHSALSTKCSEQAKTIKDLTASSDTQTYKQLYDNERKLCKSWYNECMKLRYGENPAARAENSVLRTQNEELSSQHDEDLRIIAGLDREVAKLLDERKQLTECNKRQCVSLGRDAETILRLRQIIQTQAASHQELSVQYGALRTQSLRPDSAEPALAARVAALEARAKPQLVAHLSKWLDAFYPPLHYVNTTKAEREAAQLALAGLRTYLGILK